MGVFRGCAYINREAYKYIYIRNKRTARGLSCYRGSVVLRIVESLYTASNSGGCCDDAHTFCSRAQCWGGRRE